MANSRNVLSISSFGGVDYTSPLLEVNDSRAIDINNFIKVNGVNRKRKSYEQITQAPSFTFGKVEGGTLYTIENPKDINGMWNFIAEDGNTHTVVHIGKCLFEMKNIGKDVKYTSTELVPLYKTKTHGETSYKEVTELLNQKSSAFVSGNRLYILDGSKYLLLRFMDNNTWDFIAVEDSELCYIPTTTIGITYTDSPTTNRALLDDVNLLNSKRKNTLLSGTLYNNNSVVRTTRFYEYQLDTNINFKSGQSVEDITVVLQSQESESD